MDQDRFTELTWTFLLWGLPDSELAEWQAELERRGPEGQKELSRMREAIASLALAVPPAGPPPELRDRVLSAIELAGGEAGVAGGEAGSGTLGAAGAPGGAREGAARAAGAGALGGGRAGPTRAISGDDDRVLPIRRAGREWIAAAAAAAAVAALLALWSVRLRDDLRLAREELEQTRQELASAQEEVGGARQQLASAHDQAAAGDSAMAELQASLRDLDALLSPAGSSHTLVGTPDEPRARARVFLDPATGRALLFAFDLPILPPGTVYELWAIRGGTPAAAGVFATGRDGRARVELESVQVLQGADALAVTVEPAPGRAAPTGKMVLISS